MILFNDLASQQAVIRHSLKSRIDAVLEHGRYIAGPEVIELEEKLSQTLGGACVVSCSNGTDALALTLRALGLGAGDAVFVPALTFIASAGAIVQVGAQPVFVDVKPDCYTICPSDLARKIQWTQRNTSLRPKAVIAVDLFGVPADYDALLHVAEEFGLDVVADAAHAFGSTQAGRKVGTLAKATCFSFYPGKALGCYGDGGAISTFDEDLAHRLRSLRWHGTSPDHAECLVPGVNARLDTLQAAILLAKLEIYDGEMKVRQELAQVYDGLFDGVVKRQRCSDRSRSNIGYYAIEAPNRDKVRSELSALGIQSMVYYSTPLHLSQAFSKYHHGEKLEVTELLSKTLLALPMHPYLEEENVVHVAQSVIRSLTL